MTQPPPPFGQPQRSPGLAQQPWQQGGHPGFGRPTGSSFGGWGGAPQQQPAWGTQPQHRPAPYGQQPYGQQPFRPQPYGQPAGGYPQPPGPYGQPSYGPPPGQFGGPQYPAWQPQRPAPAKRPTGLISALGVAAVVLAGLLGYAFLNPSGSPTDPPPQQIEEQYQNEDYQVPSVGDRVPDIPFPTRDSESATWLEDNAVYGTTLATPVRCDLPPLEDAVNVTEAALQERMTTLVGCLTRVWGPALEEAGFVAYQPKITVYAAGTKVQTQCGTQESLNAFYCAADQNLYLATDITKVLPAEEGAQRVVYDLIIGHEYGHAMQGRTGIFAGSRILASETSEAEAYEYSRRAEVQADCFAGLVVNSLGQSMQVTDADRAAYAEISYEIGDDRLAERFNIEDPGIGDHGIGDNRRLWTERGLATSSVGQCNTFSAPSSEVE